MKFAIATMALLSGGMAQGAVFSVSGATPGDITPTIDAFRSALGTNNGVGGSFASGRREINWDGVPDSVAAPNNMPGNFFNANSPRGAVFSGAAGFQISADNSNPTSEPVEFGGLNAGYPDQFQTFSAQRLFTATGGNTLQVDFFLPGTATLANVSGFGAVFTDVEIAGGTKFTVFLGDGSNGGEYVVPVSASGGLSFLGVTDPQMISRILIQFGTLTPGQTENLASQLDAVAMDDFIYGEPQQAAAVPEPSTWLFGAAGLLIVLATRCRS